MTRLNNTELKDVWQTPDKIVEMLPDIDLDPCAGDDTDIGDVNWNESGLVRSWFGNVFVNPPFSEKEKWLAYAVNQSGRDDVDTVFVLTPDSTDVKSWWHTHIAGHADYVWFSRGRIAYINPETGETENNPTFGTAISMFGEPSDDTLNRFAESGHLVETVNPTDI